MYLYEMHCHTSESSLCGQTTGAQMAEFYKSIGFSGIVITDHFFNGNSAVPKELEWEERINLFCKGYDEAKKRGDEIGLDVFFGWECGYKGTDVLTYGLTKDWLIEHPDCDKLSPNEYFDLVHESGGYVVHAHPFRERDYIKEFKLWPRKMDAVETLNAANEDANNDFAIMYAKHYNLPQIGGTDNHVGKRERYGVLELPQRAQSISEILEEVINEKANAEMYTHSENGIIKSVK